MCSSLVSCFISVSSSLICCSVVLRSPEILISTKNTKQNTHQVPVQMVQEIPLVMCLPCILVFLVAMSSRISCFISVSSSLICCSVVLTSSENCDLHLGLHLYQNCKTVAYFKTLQMCNVRTVTIYYKNSASHCDVHKVCNLQ